MKAWAKQAKSGGQTVAQMVVAHTAVVHIGHLSKHQGTAKSYLDNFGQKNKSWINVHARQIGADNCHLGFWQSLCFASANQDGILWTTFTINK